MVATTPALRRATESDDFNNILMGAVGNLSLAQDLVPPDQEALRTRLRHAATACARARGVTSQLLTFAKGGAPIKTAASVPELAIECTRFVLSGSAVAGRFHIADDLWAADIDTNQVAQVLHNLVLNAVVAGRPAQPAAQHRSGGGSVLLMDDDPMVAEVAQEMLEAVGFAADVACDGEDAIRRFQDAEDGDAPFDLVILDLTVPGGMGGAEAVRRIRAIRPGVTVFVTSGYADDAVLARFRDYGFDGVLPKPFTVPDLRRALGRA